jgi:hypothetical protein
MPLEEERDIKLFSKEFNCISESMHYKFTRPDSESRIVLTNSELAPIKYKRYKCVYKWRT